MRYDMSFTHVNFTQNKYFSAASSKWTSSSCYKEIILMPFSSFWLLVRGRNLTSGFRLAGEEDNCTQCHEGGENEQTTDILGDHSCWWCLPLESPAILYPLGLYFIRQETVPNQIMRGKRGKQLAWGRGDNHWMQSFRNGGWGFCFDISTLILKSCMISLKKYNKIEFVINWKLEMLKIFNTP